MKKLLTLSIILFSFFAQAQEKRKSIAINYGTGSGQVGPFGKVDGGGSKKGKSLYTIGISYLNETSKSLYFETGLHYLIHKYTSSSFYPPSPTVYFDHVIQLVSMPIKFRYEAGKYVFFNGGMYIDIDVSERDIYSGQKFSGTGAGLGIGLQYYFKNKLGIYANPQLDFRNLVSFSNVNSSNKLINGNLVFGIAYKIK